MLRDLEVSILRIFDHSPVTLIGPRAVANSDFFFGGVTVLLLPIIGTQWRVHKLNRNLKKLKK